MTGMGSNGQTWGMNGTCWTGRGNFFLFYFLFLWHFLMFRIERDDAEASQSLRPPLIIPIIMAHCGNLINNTEDIVVAVSHMVVGLCSVTTLPLASTYVCQTRAAMTSCTSAHLAIPPPPVKPPLRRKLSSRREKKMEGDPSWHLIWSEQRDKMSVAVLDGRSLGGRCGDEHAGHMLDSGGGDYQEFVRKKLNALPLSRLATPPFRIPANVMGAGAGGYVHVDTALKTCNTRWVTSSQVSLGSFFFFFTKWAALLRPVGFILQMAIKMHEVRWSRGEESSYLSGEKQNLREKIVVVEGGAGRECRQGDTPRTKWRVGGVLSRRAASCYPSYRLKERRPGCITRDAIWLAAV